MSDAELSDVGGDDDIVRRHELQDEDDEMQGNEYQDVSTEEVKVDDDDDFTAKRVDPPTTKSTVRKMVVLNTDRLKGRKGIHTIEKLYEGFKFKGKGHEKEDLDRVLKRLEYWSYRLFPKLNFDDFLDKCEHLSHKKDLQTHLKKYRLGMITADDDMCTGNDIIDEEDNEEINQATKRMESELLNGNDDAFQRLFDENVQSANAES